LGQPHQSVSSTRTACPPTVTVTRWLRHDGPRAARSAGPAAAVPIGAQNHELAPLRPTSGVEMAPEARSGTVPTDSSRVLVVGEGGGVTKEDWPSAVDSRSE
jgi:hypothetical protein